MNKAMPSAGGARRARTGRFPPGPAFGASRPGVSVRPGQAVRVQKNMVYRPVCLSFEAGTALREKRMPGAAGPGRKGRIATKHDIS